MVSFSACNISTGEDSHCYSKHFTGAGLLEWNGVDQVIFSAAVWAGLGSYAMFPLHGGTLLNTTRTSGVLPRF